MTEKELLYMEDALGHLEHICTLCQTCIANLEDRNLISLVKSIEKKNKSVKTQLLATLGGCKSNG